MGQAIGKDARSVARMSIVVGVALGLSGISLPVADNSPRDRPSEENYLSEDGMRAFVGTPSEELARLADELQLLADEHPDVFAGVALTSRYSAVEVYVADVGSPALADARTIADSSDEQVLFIENSHSLSGLLAAQDVVARMDLGDVVLSTVAPDFLADRLVVGVGSGSPEADPRSFSVDPGLAGELAEHLDVDVEVIPVPVDEPASRRDDSAPFSMGGEIRSGSKSCTLGIPINIRGVRYALTAGHCQGTDFRTPRNKHVGTMHTTTWPGNAALYGDWKLLRGDFGMALFRGGSTSSLRSGIHEGHFGTRSLGRELCASGQSGSMCRYVVVQTNAVTSIRQGDVIVRSSHATFMRHDPDRAGTSGCTGWVAGDSGGPLFSQSNVPDSYDVWGIVTATGGQGTGTCRYVATQLSGVRAWTSSATVS